MIYKKLTEVPEFEAGDLTLIREVWHPENDGGKLPFSLAHARLEPGATSLSHHLKHQIEIYFILEGIAQVTIANESRQVQKNDFVFIPKGVRQFIKNTGTKDLKFLCIVSPPWNEQDEIIETSAPGKEYL